MGHVTDPAFLFAYVFRSHLEKQYEVKRVSCVKFGAKNYLHELVWVVAFHPKAS